MNPIININGKDIDIEKFRNDWALVLMSQGVIVNLSVSRWRATTKLTPESLGLKFADNNSFSFMNQYIKLGRQKLLPPPVLMEIESLENMARNNLQLMSFDTVWGKFVPFKIFKDWEKQNQLIKEDFMAQALKLSEKYHDIIASVKSEYKILAKDVWYRLYPDKGEPTSSFIEDFTSKIVEKIPSQIDIVDSFKYNFTYFIIPMPSFIQDDINRTERINNQVGIEKIESELEIQTKQMISEEYIKRKKELIDDFIKSTVSYLRNYVSEICSEVLVSMQKKTLTDQLTYGQISKLKNMIKKAIMLNFYDDEDINRLLIGLNIEISKIKGETDRNVVINKLKEIVEICDKEYIPTASNLFVRYLGI